MKPLLLISIILTSAPAFSQKISSPNKDSLPNKFGSKGIPVEQGNHKSMYLLPSVENPNSTPVTQDERILRDNKSYYYSRGRKIPKIRID